MGIAAIASHRADQKILGLSKDIAPRYLHGFHVNKPCVGLSILVCCAPLGRDNAALFEHVPYLAPACCWGLFLNLWVRMQIRYLAVRADCSRPSFCRARIGGKVGATNFLKPTQLRPPRNFARRDLISGRPAPH
jgi:hypothetical protein